MTNNPWIQTASGRKFPLLDPDPNAIDIMDIAHALSMICRFNGQCARFYSVAEHSVHVSRLVPPREALWGLLHDATEAYLGDVASPLKKSLSDYEKIEERLMKAIAEKFGLGPKDKDKAAVKHADILMLRVERKVLMAEPPEAWPGDEKQLGESPPADTIECWPPAQAKEAFLRRFSELVS